MTNEEQLAEDTKKSWDRLVAAKTFQLDVTRKAFALYEYGKGSPMYKIRSICDKLDNPSVDKLVGTKWVSLEDYSIWLEVTIVLDGDYESVMLSESQVDHSFESLLQLMGDLRRAQKEREANINKANGVLTEEMLKEFMQEIWDKERDDRDDESDLVIVRTCCTQGPTMFDPDDKTLYRHCGNPDCVGCKSYFATFCKVANDIVNKK